MELKGREQAEARAVLLGAGERLFSESEHDMRKLAVAEHEAYANGVVKLVYDVVR